MASGSLSRRDGEAIVTLLAAARLSWGLLQVFAPGLVARTLGRPGALPRSLLRMKGGRDLAMGLGGMLVGTDAGMTRWAQAGVYVDIVDALGTLGDRGRALRPRTLVLGTPAAVGSAAVTLLALGAIRRGAVDEH